VKKIVLITLALFTVSTVALAQGRDGRNRSRLTCAINIDGKFTAYGQGRDCYESMDLARMSCKRLVKQKNASRCDNAGMFRTSRYKVNCSEVRTGYRVNCTPY
jgi:hypothetical protein